MTTSAKTDGDVELHHDMESLPKPVIVIHTATRPSIDLGFSKGFGWPVCFRCGQQRVNPSKNQKVRMRAVASNDVLGAQKSDISRPITQNLSEHNIRVLSEKGGRVVKPHRCAAELEGAGDQVDRTTQGMLPV